MNNQDGQQIGMRLEAMKMAIQIASLADVGNKMTSQEVIVVANDIYNFVNSQSKITIIPETHPLAKA